MTPTHAGRFATFASRLEFSDLPPTTQRTALLHFLDTLAAGVAGADSAEAAATRAALPERGPAVIWGTAQRGTPSTAALLNGVAAHAFELDDSGGCDHSGAVVVPATLAAATASRGPVDGQRMLLATVLGYELGRRVQTALGGYDSVNDRGWHSTGICGPFAAAAAASAVLRLDPLRTAHAIGLAATAAAGSWAFIGEGAMSKRLHVGQAARAGVESALLASHGFTGPQEVFEAAWGGFLDLYRGAAPAQPRALTDGLGAVWQVDRASIKPHATCRSTHAAIDAVLDIRARLDRARIDRIEIRTSRLIMDMCGGTSVDTLTKAQLSLPFAVAVAAVFGQVGLEDVLAGRRESRVQHLMRDITVTVDPAQVGGTALPHVTCHADDGTSHTVQAVPAKGAPENVLTREEVEAKVRRLFRRRLDTTSIDKLMAVLDSPSIPDPLAIAEMVSTSPAPSR